MKTGIYLKVERILDFSRYSNILKFIIPECGIKGGNNE